METVQCDKLNGQGRVRLKILKNIHVVFAKRELVPILAYVWSITCSWVHKRYSSISGKLKSNDDFHCTRCFRVVMIHLLRENGVSYPII